MADLPEFQENSQVTPGPLISAAPIYQANAKIADDIDDVTEPIAQNLRDQQVSNQAQQDGSNLNFKAIPQIGVSSEVYNQIGLQANKDAISTSIITGLNAYHQQALNADGTIDPAAVQKFSQASQAQFNGLMQTVPFENRAWAKSLWASKVSDLQMNMQKQVMQQQKSNEAFNAFQASDAYGGEMVSANMQGNWQVAKSMLGAKIASAQKYGETGVLNPRFAAAQIQQAHQDYYTSYYQGNIQKILNNPNQTPATAEQANNLVQQFQNDPNVQASFKDPASLNAATKQLQEIIKQHGAKQTVNAQDLQRIKAAGLDQALHTGNVDPSIVQTVDAGDRDPLANASWHNQISMSQNLGQVKQSIINGTVSDAQNQLSQVQNMQKSLNWNDPLTSEDQKIVIARAMPILQQTLKEKLNNPMDSLQNNPNFIQDSQNITNSRNNYPDYKAAITQKALDYQQQQGFTPGQYSVLTSNQLKTIAVQTSNLNPGQQLDYINKQIVPLVGNNPEFINTAMQQLQKYQKTSSSLFTLYATAQDPSTQQYSDDVGNALSQNTNQWLAQQKGSTDIVKKNDLEKTTDTYLDSTLSVLKNQMAVSSYNADQNTQLQNVRNAAYNLAAYYVGQKSVDVNTAAKNAANIIVNDHYNTDSLMGSPYLVPKYSAVGQPIDPSAVHLLLQSRISSAIDKGLIVPSNFENPLVNQENPKAAQQNYVYSLMNQMHVINSGGTGLVIQDNNKNIVRTTDGQPVQLNWSELQNMSPEDQKTVYGNYTNPIAKFILGRPSVQGLIKDYMGGEKEIIQSRQQLGMQ